MHPKAFGAPKPLDFVDPTYQLNKRSDIYFDPWIRFERCLAAVNPEDILKPCAQWAAFGSNDDSSEVPAQPNGTRSNAVLRVKSSSDDPLKALVRGVYRIAIANDKGGEVQGSFIAQIGSPNDLHGLAMGRTPADLARAIGEKGSIAKETPIAK